jgi:hypothetical protein
MVITSDNAYECDVDSGYSVTVTVAGGLRRLVQIWRGDLTWTQVLRFGEIGFPAGPRCAVACLAGSRCASF